MTALHFKTIQWKKGKNSPKPIPFKTISPPRWNVCLSRWTPATWTSDPCHLMNLTYLKHPHHLQHHASGTTHPDHHHIHLPHHSHQENHWWRPVWRTLCPKAGKDTDLNQLSSDPMTLTEDSQMDFQHYWMKCHSLHPTNLRDQPRPKPDRLLALCIDSFQNHLGEIHELCSNWLISRPLHTWQYVTPFKTLMKYSQICNYYLSICSTKCTSFKTLQFSMGNTLQIDSFQDPYIGLYSVSVSMGEIPQLTALNSPWESTFRNCLFQEHPYTVYSGLISRPCRGLYITFSEIRLLSRPLQRTKEQ